MQVREYKDEDYSLISKWYEEYGADPIPSDCLSKTGAIIDDTAALFLFSTDSSIGILEFAVTNPSLSRETRYEAISLLINHLMERARDKGMKHLISFVKLDGLKSLLKEHGFEESESEMSQMAGRF